MLKADEPLIYAKDNSLYPKVEGIKNLIETKIDFLKKNNLIALYGEWGSGKSSIFKTLQNELDKDKYIPLIFQAWKYEKDSNLPLSLYDFILDNIISDKTTFKAVCKEGIRDALYSFFRGTTLNFEFLSIDFEKMIKAYDEKKDNSLYTLTENFLDKFKEQIDKYRNKKEIIIFIDDLDRCDDENIINLLSALKLMFSVDNIIFVCGIDKKAIEQTLLNKYNDEEKAKKYLEKIFSINFNIENNIKIEEFFNSTEDLAEFKFKVFEGLNEKNPRNINRILNKFNIMCQLIPIEQIINTHFKSEPKEKISAIEIIVKVYLFLKLIFEETKIIDKVEVKDDNRYDIDSIFKRYPECLYFKNNQIVTGNHINIMPTKIQSLFNAVKNTELKKNFIWSFDLDNNSIKSKIVGIFSIEFYKYY
jgi:anti-anti-sigma regulatory factor